MSTTLDGERAQDSHGFTNWDAVALFERNFSETEGRTTSSDIVTRNVAAGGKIRDTHTFSSGRVGTIYPASVGSRTVATQLENDSGQCTVRFCALQPSATQKPLSGKVLNLAKKPNVFHVRVAGHRNRVGILCRRALSQVLATDRSFGLCINLQSVSSILLRGKYCCGGSSS